MPVAKTVDEMMMALPRNEQVMVKRLRDGMPSAGDREARIMVWGYRITRGIGRYVIFFPLPH